MRRISAVAVGQPLDDERRASGGRLGPWPTGWRRPPRRPSDGARTQAGRIPDGHPQDFFPTSPVIGFANPVAPPVEVWAVEGEDGQREIRGRVTFGYPYEGPPTCVHGGVIAELFDELLGWPTSWSARAR